MYRPTILRSLRRQRPEREWRRVTMREAAHAQQLIVWTRRARLRAFAAGQDTTAYDAWLADLVPLDERAVGD